MEATMDVAECFVRGGGDRLRVLVVSALPVGEGVPLDLRREWRSLRDAAAKGRLPVTLVRLLPPTPERLRAVLADCRARGVPPHVVHFAGHGTPTHLSLEDELGHEAKLTRADLLDALDGAGVQLLVLNACHSATRQTVSLARAACEVGYVTAALGHGVPVPDEAALAFALGLYRSLCDGEAALAAYVRARDAIARDFGASGDAVELFGDPALLLRADGARGALDFDGRSERGNLPTPATFHGRGEDLVALASWLADDAVRAVALAGMGGIGKTTLTWELGGRHAWRYPGGMAFATMRGQPERSADGLLRAALRALLVSCGEKESAAEALAQHARSAPTLAVFDNLEDLPDDELTALLRALERLPDNGSKALLTLRTAPLRLEEFPWLRVKVLVEGLSPMAGARYVAQLAREKKLTWLEGREDASRGYPEGPPLLLTLALGGHPKMLEMAVGIAKQRGRPALAKAVPELERAEAELARGLAAGAMERRLDELLTASVDVLDDAGRAVVSLLPFFPAADFTREEMTAALAALRGAEAAGVEEEAAAGIASCAEAGWVDQDGEREVWRFHPTIAAYASRAHGVEAEAGGRVVDALLGATLAHVAATSQEPGALRRRLGHVLGMFEGVWGGGEVTDAAHRAIASAFMAMHDALYQWGYWSVLERWHPRLEATGDETSRARALRLCQRAVLLKSTGDLPQARGLLRESIAILEELGDKRGHAASLHQLAITELAQGNLPEALRLLRESVAVDDELGDRRGRATSLHVLASIEHTQGNLPEARRLLRESFVILEELGDKWGRAVSLHELARIEHTQGNLPEARRLLRESVAVEEELGDKRGRAASLHELARIELAQGNLPEARRLLRESFAVLEALGDRQGRAASLHLLANIEYAQGNLPEARRLLRESITIKDELGDREGRAASIHALSTIEYAQGNLSEARRLLRESIAVAEDLGDKLRRAASLRALARIEHTQGNLPEARRLLRESVAVAEELGDKGERAASFHGLAGIEHEQGNLPEVRRLLRESIAIKEELGDKWGRAVSLHELARIEHEQGNLPEACRLLRESIAIKDELGDREGRAVSLIMLGQLEASAGDRTAGARTVREGVRLLRELGSGRLPMAERILRNLEQDGATAPTSSLSTTLNEVARLLERGEPSGALHILQALGPTLDAHNNDARATASFLAARALDAVGRHAEALAALDVAARLFDSPDTAPELAAVRSFRAEVEAHASGNAPPPVDLVQLIRERPDEALRLLDAALEQAIVANNRDAVERLRALREQARAVVTAHALASTPEAELLADAADLRDELTRRLRRVAALATLGRLDDALAAADTALARAESTSEPELLFQTLHLQAQLLAAAGRIPDARAVAARARELAKPLGPRAEAAVDALERSLPKGPPHDP